jgi:hypothetical protein
VATAVLCAQPADLGGVCGGRLEPFLPNWDQCGLPGCGPAMDQVAGQYLLPAVSRVPSPSRLHPVSIPSPLGVAFMAAITLGEAVRVVAVWAAVGFAGLPGPAGLADSLFSRAGKRPGGAGE